MAIFTGAASSTMKCFVAGTIILTAAGLVAIENIKAGDKVISTNAETFEVAEKRVLETYIRETTELVHLTINGELIKTTYDHPFYVKGFGFVSAGELYIGDKLLDSNGNTLIVEDRKLEIFDEAVKVYNFQIEDFHTYYVGENCIWVHNANCIVHSDGEIEITDWEGYSENGPKPKGKLKLLDKKEYAKALKEKNAAIRKYHRSHPECDGMEIHEVHPVKFSGSLTDVNNKIPLSPEIHRMYTKFWATIKAKALKN